jgi:photosystem II stability/assembly factor-like uncharacterized protein
LIAWEPVFSSPEDGAWGVSLGRQEVAIVTTTDGGASWSVHNLKTEPQGGDTTLDVVSPSTWVVAVGATVTVTADAGAHWTTVHSNEPASSIMDFVDVRDGWSLIGNSSALFHTTDGGRIWVGVPLGKAT